MAENDRFARGVFVPAVVVEFGPRGERFELEVRSEVGGLLDGDLIGHPIFVGGVGGAEAQGEGKTGAKDG